MSRIERVFEDRNKKALIGYVTVGFPNIESTLKIVPLLVENGCDIIELGIPFSDPLADGPVIQKSSYEALQQGVTTEKCIEVAIQLRKTIDVPLVFMGYYNPVLHYGPDRFCKDSAAAGIDGFIIPDLPPEEGVELESIAQTYGIDLIYLLAPTSGDDRISIVAEKSQGFVYLVSLTGVTGSGTELPPELEEFVKRVRQKTSKPLCVGFGITNPEQARRVASVADGIIVGSRFIKLIEEDPSLSSLQSLVQSLKTAL
ncbi:MAG: tryptophan synthase subunit alpha [Chloroflexi bacterium]|jgi:tryptophan synthase alpha chain|nr:tryptophan synthase subunit alpha [Chloroflexota bacterium]